MSVSFQNNGMIDMRAVTTFGVSSKDSEDSIGQFGTGLKYAIAILLRHNCHITIYRGLDPYTFGSIEETIRNDQFHTVTMNGDALGFTTHLGHHWELWQAYRELYCNALDENGETTGTVLNPLDGKTTIVVEGQAFRDVHHTRRDFILEPDLIFKGSTCEIHRGMSNSMFYQGIKVAELENPSLYTYNLTSYMELTEDRSLKSQYELRWEPSVSVVQCNDKDVISSVLLAGEQAHESNFPFPAGEPSKQFIDVVNEFVSSRNKKFNPSALKRVGLKPEDLLPKEAVDLDSVDQKRLDKALSFCERIGFPISDYPVIVTDNLGQGVLGQAAQNKIFISTLAFEQGTKMLAGTLMEEFMHLKFKVSDCTREMQNMLVDSVMSMGERVVGEPL